MYQFDYFDASHIVAESSKWLGGYYGLVYKRVVIDGKKWEPLKPVSHSITGTSIDLFFNKNNLTLDTVLVPMQANYGFDVLNDVGGVVAINSVTVIAPNRIRITCAGSPSVKWHVRYGHNTATGKGVFTGGCGNLRDRQGDSVIYFNKPLHNWCVIFNYSL